MLKLTRLVKQSGRVGVRPRVHVPAHWLFGLPPGPSPFAGLGRDLDLHVMGPPSIQIDPLFRPRVMAANRSAWCRSPELRMKGRHLCPRPAPAVGVILFGQFQACWQSPDKCFARDCPKILCAADATSWPDRRTSKSRKMAWSGGKHSGLVGKRVAGMILNGVFQQATARTDIASRQP